jgi:hypothetical protein
MDLSRLTHAVAREEERQKRQDINVNVIGALARGALFSSGHSSSFERETLSDLEVSFLSEIKSGRLTDEKDIYDLGGRFGLPETRLREMQGRYFEALSAEERLLLNAISEVPGLEHGPAFKSLEQKGFVYVLSPAQRTFLDELGALDLSKDRDSRVLSLAERHGINFETLASFQKAGVINVPSDSELLWLNAFKAGAGRDELQKIADAHDIRSYSLKNRISIDSEARRNVRFNAIVKEGPVLLFDEPKVRWYEAADKVSIRKLAAVETPSREDLRLLADPSRSHSVWQSIRCQRLQESKVSDKHFMRELFSTLGSNEKAAILAVDASDLTRRQAAFRAEFGHVFDNSLRKSERAQLISNDEYFFLAALRRDPSAMDSLSQRYGVTPSKLKASGHLDYLDDDEKEVLLAAGNGKDLSEHELEKLEELRKRGFVHSVRDQERSFLEYVQRVKPPHKAALLEIGERFLFDETKLQGLKSRGFLDYLDQNEIDYLREMQGKPDDPEAVRLKHDVMKPARFKGRMLADGIDQTVTVDMEDKLRLNPRVQYREDRGLLEARISRQGSYRPLLQEADVAILVKVTEGVQRPSLAEFERYAELKAAGLSFESIVFPSNTEVAFLRKVAWRRENPDTLRSIARTDFGLSPEDVERLERGGYLSTRGGKYKPYSEPALIQNARVWLNSSESMRKKLGLNQPSDAVLRVLKDRAKPTKVGEKLMDYEIYFKIQRGEKLLRNEQERLGFLRENGVHPEGRDFQEWMSIEPKSWRMKDARREAYLGHYEKAYGVNLEVLTFLNTFKQMTGEQLIREGLSEDELKRYAEGVSGGKHRLLRKYVLPQHGAAPVVYYGLSHDGPISGRKFLERMGISKSAIAERTQQRKDLLLHDLKVVDAVQIVRDMKRADGLVPKKILNESMQFSNAKTGLGNSERAGGPAFLDAQIVFAQLEEPTQQQGRGGGSTETIGVEYGNYSLERMQKKLEAGKFDHAYVFAKPEYVAIYQRNIPVANVTYIPMR